MTSMPLRPLEGRACRVRRTGLDYLFRFGGHDKHAPPNKHDKHAPPKGHNKGLLQDGFADCPHRKQETN
jgi:hypothetical protein